METNVNYTVVGAFVITLITFVILMIIWLSAGFSSESYATYQVYMRESVSGLSKNAVVEYNGVNVGNVTSIKINPKTPNAVDLLLKIKKGTPVTQGTRAKLDTRTLSGVAFIQLEDRGIDTTPLKAKPGEAYPVIQTTPSFFFRLNEVLAELNTSFRQLTDSFRQISDAVGLLLDEDNLKTIKESLKNIHELTGALAKDKGKITDLIQNYDRAAEMLHSKTLPNANEMISNFNHVGHNLSEASEMVKQNPAVLIRGKEPAPLGPGEK